MTYKASRILTRFSERSCPWMRCACLVFACLMLWGSTVVAESIETQLSKAEELRSKDFTEFVNILENLEYSKDQMSQDQKDFLQFLTGYKHAYLGENTEAVAAYESIILTSEDERLKFRARISAANVLAIARKYEKSLRHLDDALSEIEQMDSSYLRHQAFVIASIIYNLYGNYELAENFSELIMNDHTASQRDRCAASHIKYRILLKQDKIEADDTAVADAIDFCNSVNEKIYTLFIIYEQAEYYLRRDQADLAITVVKASFNDAIDSKHSNIISLFNHIMAQANWIQGNKAQAAEFAQKSLSLANANDFNYQIGRSYNLLHQYHSDLQEHEQALYYHKKYMESDKAYLDDVMAKSMALQSIKHRNIESAQRIKLLSQENQLLTLQQTLTKKRAQNMRLVLTLIGLMAAIVLWWAFLIKKKQIIFKKQAQLDHLTNIFNRKAMDDYAKQRLPQCEHKKSVVSFAIFDLDLFKKINDDYGHAVGDWVIRRVIETSLSLNEDNLIFGRLGGEEFGIYAENTSVVQLRDFCQRCRLAISQIDTLETGYTFSITASYGVTSTSISGYDYEHLMADADAAMYEAKKSGRDQVALYSNKLSVVK